ncbi:MAG: hypothetical protein IJW13_03330 [Clostridia bacterium]|nr:hypothetical protein [Clostridia bacterium]
MKQKTRLLLTTVLALAVAFSLCISMIFSAFAATEEVMQDGNYVGRTFNADYDKMIEDFAVSQPANQANYVSDGVLQVAYNGDENSNNMDGAIYKIASSTASTTTPWPYTHLVFEMSSPDGSATLEELAIHLREVGDASTTAAIDLNADILDPSSLTQIGTTKTAIALDLLVYVTNAELTSLVNGGLAGYHLVAKAGCTGTLVIHDVYLANLEGDEVPAFGAPGIKTLADFEKDGGVDQKVDDTIYWCGSEVGQIIPKHIALNNGEYTLAAGVANYENVALTVRGTGALTVGGVAWAELKGPDGNALPAITQNFATYVINLNASGLAASDVAIKLTATGEIDVKNAFLTNMEVAEAEIQQVPFIDASTAVRVDDFAYANKTPLGGDYDAAFADPANADAGVQYRLSYSNADKLSIANGMLTINATELGDGYVNFKTQSVKTIENYKYFVLKVKGEEGASLEGFRFGLGVDGNAPHIIWGNGGLKADTNLLIPALGASPYKTQDGWEYVVVDIAASGLGCGNTVDMYYSGAGKLHIDEMFYCNGLDRGISYQTTTFNAEALIEIDATAGAVGYVYNYLGNGTGMAQRYLVLDAKGENGAALNELRIEFAGAGGVYWFGENAQGVLLGTDGQMLPALTEEYQTYVIDLEKMGVEWQKITDIHLHATLAQGKISIKNAGFATLKIDEANTNYPSFNAEQSFSIGGNGGYQYVSHFYFGENVALNRYLAITVKGDEGIMNNELRLEFDGGIIKYWKDNEQLLLDPQGAPLGEITAEYNTFYIDLDAIGVPRTANYFHLHSTANTAANISIQKIGYATADKYNYATLAMPSFDTVKPQVTVTVPQTAQVGDSIQVQYVATDDVTAANDLQVAVNVTFGGTPVELENNTFVCEEGTYVVTVTVTDAEGNTANAEATITVTAKQNDNPPASSSGDDKPEPNESCFGSIGGGTIGLAMLLGVALVALRKKERE